MNNCFASRRTIMKRFLVCALFIMSFSLSACGGYHMITKDVKPSITAKSGKAMLVIIRPTKWGGTVGAITIGGGHIVTNYLDAKMIGQTHGKSYFITEVKPGTHYLMAQSENIAVARLNFEAGKIYVLQQLLFPGFNPLKKVPRTGFAPMTAGDFVKEFKDADYLVYDTAHPGKDMSQKDFQEAKTDFEREVKEDPARHKDTLAYKGFKKLM